MLKKICKPLCLPCKELRLPCHLWTLRILLNWNLIEIPLLSLNSFWIQFVFSSKENYSLLLWCKLKSTRKKEEWFLSYKIPMKKEEKLVWLIWISWKIYWTSKKIKFLKKLLKFFSLTWVKRKTGSLKRLVNKYLKLPLVLWLGLSLFMNIMRNPRLWSPNKLSWKSKRVNWKLLMLN